MSHKPQQCGHSRSEVEYQECRSCSSPGKLDLCPVHEIGDMVFGDGNIANRAASH